MRRWVLLKAQAEYYRQRFRLRLTAWLKRPRSLDERNALHLYGDIAWFGIANGILGTFTSVFAIRLGASETLIGLLSSLPALINIVWQVPAARLVERQAKLRPITVASLLATRLVYLIIAIMPFILVRYRAEAFVALIVLGTLPGALAGVAFTSLFAEATPPDKRARINSVRNMLLSLTGMLSVMVAGRLLDIIAFPYNYQIFFAVAFAASMASLWHVRHIIPLKERALVSLAAQGKAVGSLGSRLRASWQGIRAERGFANFVLASFVLSWGMNFPMALYGLYRVRDLGASDTFLGLLATVSGAVQTAAYLAWGGVVKKRGPRWVLLANVLGLCTFPLLTGLTTTVEPLLLVGIIGGIFSAGYSLGNFGALLEVTPADRMPTYVAMYNTILNVSAFVAPLLGTTVAGVIGTRYALILAGFLRLIGFIVMSCLEFGHPYTGPSLIVRAHRWLDACVHRK